MGVWNIMEMVGIVDVAMVAEDVDVDVEGAVLSEGEEEAMVVRLLVMMTTVNLMHHLPHVVSLHCIGIYLYIFFIILGEGECFVFIRGLIFM